LEPALGDCIDLVCRGFSYDKFYLVSATDHDIFLSLPYNFVNHLNVRYPTTNAFKNNKQPTVSNRREVNALELNGSLFKYEPNHR
jgi:hypothetical protein